MKHENPQRARPLKRSLETSLTGEMLDFEPPTKSRRMVDEYLPVKDTVKFNCKFCPSKFTRQFVLNMHLQVSITLGYLRLIMRIEKCLMVIKPCARRN
jgi:hypothetical protein